jgi:hypothetical protein
LWCRSSLEKATQGDEPGLDQTLEAQAQSGLERPPELYADGGYISGPRLHRAARGRLVADGPGAGRGWTACRWKLSRWILRISALIARRATKADVAAAFARTAKPRSPTASSGGKATANAAHCESIAFQPTNRIAR